MIYDTWISKGEEVTNTLTVICTTGFSGLMKFIRLTICIEKIKKKKTNSNNKKSSLIISVLTHIIQWIHPEMFSIHENWRFGFSAQIDKCLLLTFVCVYLFTVGIKPYNNKTNIQIFYIFNSFSFIFLCLLQTDTLCYCCSCGCVCVCVFWFVCFLLRATFNLRILRFGPINTMHYRINRNASGIH